MSDGQDGALSYTLQQIYKANVSENANDYAFAFYNDEKPDGSTSSSRGHTKGVVGLTQAGGFWLIHSIPQFPTEVVNGYSGYDAATEYGQSLLCISLSFDSFSIVGTQFQYTYPWWYDYNMPSWVPSTLLNSVTKSNHTTAVVSSTQKLTASGTSLSFTSFAKTGYWNNYLYEDLVAPTLAADLYCETWMNGGGTPDPTTCKNSTCPYDVINVRVVSIAGVTWKETQDHSKWCSTTHGAPQYTCIGDINRQLSQNTRAGGTVCFINSAFWTSVNGMISQADTCPS